MPYVICWLQDVMDSTALEFTQKFYRALVEQPGERKYSVAFKIATDAMISSRVLSTQDMSQGHVRGKGGKLLRYVQKAYSMYDVIQFLSEEEDIGPIYFDEIRRQRRAL